MTTDDKSKSRVRELELLAASSRVLVEPLEFDALVNAILKIARQALRAEAVVLALMDKEGKRLVFKMARGRRDKNLRGAHISFDQGVAGSIARKRKPVVVNRAADIKRYSLTLERKLGLKPDTILGVPLMWRNKFVGVLEAINRRGEPFNRDDLALAEAFGNHIAQAAGSFRLYERAERIGLQYSRLADVSADVGKSLSLDEVLDRIIDSLSQLIPFDAAAIFLNDREAKTITSVLHRGYPKGSGEKIHMKSHEGIVGLAARLKKGIIVDDVREHPRYCEARAKTRSELVAPIMSGRRVIGMCNLESNRIAAFGKRDLELLELFTTHAAVAIERAHVYADQRERRAIQRELRLARTVQTFFTPQRSLTIGKYRIAGVSYPSLEVSGDYHDYFPIGDGRVAFAVADVAGKGVPASIIMSCFRATLHAVGPDLRTALQITLRANRVLIETVRPQDFVTAFIGVIDGNTGEVTYCNAGHNPPILMKPDGGYRTLESGGPILGVFDDPPMIEGCFKLRDEVFLCYTDGATEARSPDDVEYGEDRLVDAMRDNIGETPARMGRNLFAALKEFTLTTDQGDDTTYLVLRKK